MIGEQGWKPRTEITIVCVQYIELASTPHQPDIGLDRSLVERRPLVRCHPSLQYLTNGRPDLTSILMI